MLFGRLWYQLQLQREAEEQRLKEEEEKKEKLRLLRERKELEKRVSYLLKTCPAVVNINISVCS